MKTPSHPPSSQNRKDYEAAFRLFQQALTDYPDDARAIMLTANAARLANHLEEAAGLYERAVARDPQHAGTTLLGLIQTYAALKRWPDFDRTRSKARDLSLGGNRFLPADRGYVIEDLREPTLPKPLHVQVVEYPKPHGRFHTHLRFFILSDYDPITHFTPYVDVESDDIDQLDFQKTHPEQAARGQRSFSLDA